MSTTLLPNKSIKEHKNDLSLFKSYTLLNINTSEPSISATASHNPFSPQSNQSPETPKMTRQRSTSFRHVTTIPTTQATESEHIPLALNQSKVNQSATYSHTCTKTVNNPQNININISEELKEETTTPTAMSDFTTSLSSVGSLPRNNEISTLSDKQILYENGYEIQRIICDTPQGTLYEAVIISDPNRCKVAIKKAEKTLYSKGIGIENNMNIITHENIIKEAMILHHLTTDNQPTADYIAKFIHFLETEHSYFLIMEYCGDVTLKEFCESAFEYVKQSKLAIKEYKRIMKYLFWQIAVTLHWMNNDMHCCHLDLNMENIIVQNGTFSEDENGNVSICQELYLKVIDFGLAEIFKVKRKKKNKMKEEKEEEYIYKYEYDPYEVDWNNIDGNPFFCRKFSMKNHGQYRAPQIWMEEPYDARKSDSWDMGIILFKLITGSYPYVQADAEKDTGYWCIENGNLQQYLEINNLLQFVNGSVLNLLNGLLSMEEDERFLSSDIIYHSWFKSYYAKYKDRIEQKSIEQKQKRKEQKKKMKLFPYYNINGDDQETMKLSSKSLI